MIELTKEQIDQFHEDGFLVVDKLLEEEEVERLTSRFEPLFRGDFETGVSPDEVNWQEGRDSPALTRQLCNGWKADRSIASITLREDIGRACAQLGGWPGARVMIDNIIWKPASTRPLGMHQDNSYLTWFQPQELMSCWMALDETHPDGGTMEVVRGSHRWGRFPPAREFHGPELYRQEMEAAAASVGANPEVVPIVVPRGGGSFHHGWTWHGSGFNRRNEPRRTVVVHAMSSEARFVPGRLGEGTGKIYSRYKRFGSNEMDENYFPILWTEDGRRTPGLDAYIRGED